MRVFLCLFGAAIILLFVLENAAAQTTEAPPLLSEAEAVSMAKGANRQNRQTQLGVDQAKRAIWQAKTSLFPISSVEVTSGHPLFPFSFEIPKGVLGSYPNTGPIPSTNVGLSAGQSFTETTYAYIAQPLTQLYAAHLGVKIAVKNRDIAAETYRQKEQATTAQVRETYHQICVLEVQVAHDAAQEKALGEVVRVSESGVKQGTALLADSLQAQATLKQQLYTTAKDQDMLTSTREQLNALLARDIETPFSVSALSDPLPEELSLPEARAFALNSRPEVRLGKLQIEKAELQVKQEKAGYLPSLNAQLTYVGFQNVELLPPNVAIAGFALTWTNPWDWGNRRAAIASLRDSTTQQKLSLDDQKAQVTTDIDQKFRALRQARLLVEAAQTAKQASGEKLRNLVSRLQQEQALPSDVLTQAAADQAQSLAYAQALLTYWNAEADFDHSLGKD